MCFTFLIAEVLFNGHATRYDGIRRTKGKDERYDIGFAAFGEKEEKTAEVSPAMEETRPRRSLVQVRFPERGMTLSYYNDRFDLHRGDFV